MSTPPLDRYRRFVRPFDADSEPSPTPLAAAGDQHRAAPGDDRPTVVDDTATAVVVATLLADLPYARLDPRITD